MIHGSDEHGQMNENTLRTVTKFGTSGGPLVGIRTKLFLGLLCEWLVLPSDEFDNGFRSRKRGAVLTKRNIQEVREWRSDVSKWWLSVEVISHLFTILKI